MTPAQDDTQKPKSTPTLEDVAARAGVSTATVSRCLNTPHKVVEATRHKVMSAILCILLLSSLMVSLIILVEPVRRRLLGSDYGTSGVRPPLARVALNMIRHKPLTGVGIGNYTLVMGRYDNTKQGLTKYFPAPVHNEFLLIAAELGIPAAGFFIFILGVLLKNLFAMGRSRELSVQSFLAIGFFGAWLGWCLHNQFEYQYVFYSGLIWFYIGLILAAKHQLSAYNLRHENTIQVGDSAKRGNPVCGG